MRPWHRRALVVVTLSILPWLASGAGDPDESLQARFDHENNSVHKAKLFKKLGGEQLAQTRRASEANDYTTIGEVMEKYRDNARATLDALKKQHPNAEHQLNGYKQLQMQVREALRDLKELILLAPSEYKPPLQLVQQDLSSMDDELLRSLFPPGPRPKIKSPPASPAADEPPPLVAKEPSSPTATQPPSAAAEEPPDVPARKSEENAATNSQPKPEDQLVETTEEKTEMNVKNCLLTAVVTCGLAVSCGQLEAQETQKDYLSPLEADKIRDAETTNARINLFMTFADDRLKKFQYELQHPSSVRHGDLLNGLMNGYVGCLDDAADLMQLGIEKQENIRQGIDSISTHAKEFLEQLNKIAADKIEIDIYKDNLDDAIEGTRDAISDSEKAKKSVAPPPIRRKN